MTAYTYMIDPFPAELGGGWQLRLLEDGEEVGGGIFPDQADALAEAWEWIKMWYCSALDSGSETIS